VGVGRLDEAVIIFHAAGEVKGNHQRRHGQGADLNDFNESNQRFIIRITGIATPVSRWNMSSRKSTGFCGVAIMHR
jgi:hypothetical protein